MYYYEIAVTAQSVILGFACARLLHATPHLFLKLCDLKIYLVWYVLCLHILITFWTTINIAKLPDYDFLDFVVLMNYHEDKAKFDLNIESIKKEIQVKKFDKIIIGISIWNQESSDVQVRVNESQKEKFKGISLFSYESQKDDIFYFKNIFDNIDGKNDE